MKFEDLKNDLSSNNLKSYSKADNIALEISDMILEARIIRGITQKDLAQKMKTKQPSIARIENGNMLPSIGFLIKMAEALDTELISPKFKLVEDANLNIEKHFKLHNVRQITQIKN